MSSPRLKNFCETVYQKVQLATAIYIILHTPPGKSVVEYVKQLQESVRREWHASEPFDAASKFRPQVERVAIRQHQIKVAEQLNSLTDADAPYQCVSGTGPGSGFNLLVNTESSGQDENICHTDVSDLDFSEDVETTLRANLDFVRGVVRLQTLVARDEESVIPGHKLKSVMNQASFMATQSTADSAALNMRVPQRSYGNSLDSGIGSCESGDLCGVAKGVVEYTLQSSNSEMLVKKSVQEILRDLCGIALTSTSLYSTILNWEVMCQNMLLSVISDVSLIEGSVIQHSVAVIRQFSYNKTYQKIISRAYEGLFRVLLADILRDTGCEESMKREYQSSLLLQICGEATTCAETLNLLIEKINVLSDEMKNNENGLKEPTASPYEGLTGDESSYYIFYLAEKLLKRYYDWLRQSDHLATVGPLRTNTQESKISELWRGNWGQDVEQGDDIDDEAATGEAKLRSDGVAENWRVSLENIAVKSSFYQPLFSFYASTCLRIISQYEKCSKSENVQSQEMHGC